jgi:thioredoxin reductase
MFAKSNNAENSGDMDDVIIVGAGTGGLSAALTLARSRRSVVVIDGGEPRNARADGVHNYLTRDGTPPAELLALGRAEVLSYGVRVIDGQAVSTTRIDGGFEVTLGDGSVQRGRRLVIATGARDELPDLPGVAEGWGHSVIHCPYCHGWEVRDQRIGVLGTGPGSIHQALLFSQLSDDVTLYLQSLTLTDADRAALESRQVRITEGVIASVESLGVDALVVATTPVPRLEAFAGIGVTPETIESTPGVWVIGNAAEPNAQVIGAAAAGVMAAARINWDLIEATLPSPH